jgi:hypothetical protein
MRYMLLIYQKEQEGPPSPEEAERARAGHWAVMEETKKAGIYRGAEPLQPTSAATTIRRQGDTVVTLDGPFAETKEQLAGYYILDCKDLDEAIGWASKIPLVCSGGQGCIEIRPIRPLTVQAEEPAPGSYATSVNG